MESLPNDSYYAWHTNTHQSAQEKSSYYISHTTTKTLYYFIWKILHETKIPTVYSIGRTHYYIVNLTNFNLGHVKCKVNTYYGLIIVH